MGDLRNFCLDWLNEPGDKAGRAACLGLTECKHKLDRPRAELSLDGTRARVPRVEVVVSCMQAKSRASAAETFKKLIPITPYRWSSPIISRPFGSFGCAQEASWTIASRPAETSWTCL
jgi:hypothetical protein